MALTKISTDTIADSAITAAKIADGTVVAADVAADAVTTVKVADNAITLAKMAGGTDGQVITYDASGDPVAVGPGTDGQVLTSTGAGSPPAFEAVAQLTDNSVTLAKMAGGTDGQIITYDASGDPVAVGPGTDGQVLTSTGAGSPPAFEAAAAGGYTAATPWTSTSGTSHDFTGIPAGVKHIMILFRSTSLSGTESFDINLGDAGGIETGTDHMCSGHVIHGTTLTTLSSGDALQVLIANAAHAANVVCHLVNIEDTNWVFAYSGHTWYTGSALGGGSKNISDTLTQIRVSSSSSNTFDYGYVNIVYL